MSPTFDRVLAGLKRTRGVDLSGYRTGIVTRRVAARMDRVGHDDADAYLQMLQSDPLECDQLIDAIAINVTEFFRDPIVFELVAHATVP